MWWIHIYWKENQLEPGPNGIEPDSLYMFLNIPSHPAITPLVPKHSSQESQTNESNSIPFKFKLCNLNDKFKLCNLNDKLLINQLRLNEIVHYKS